MDMLKFWVWLSSLSGVGVVSGLRLLNHFGDPQKVFSAGAQDYLDVEGIGRGEIPKLLNKDLDKANRILAECAESSCNVVTFEDELYPIRLKNIYDPPLVLYVRGCLPVIDEEPVVSIVGTRRCTPYGSGFAESIGKTLSGHGIVVATGLALGIDSAAARGAISGGGCVVGVTGSGLNVVYPPENKALFDEVTACGAIISEYPPNTPALKKHFPARNRLISGISVGVAVIEAPRRSGALITAARALEQGRDVFTLPGNVGAYNCEGSNALLRDGAIPILSASDIIGEYIEIFPGKITAEFCGEKKQDTGNFDAARYGGTKDSHAGKQRIVKKEIDNTSSVDYIDSERIIETLMGDEQIVAGAIGSDCVHIDKIIQTTCLSPGQVLTAITMLEIRGCVIQSGGKFYSLTNPQ